MAAPADGLPFLAKVWALGAGPRPLLRPLLGPGRSAGPRGWRAPRPAPPCAPYRAGHADAPPALVARGRTARSSRTVPGRSLRRAPRACHAEERTLSAPPESRGAPPARPGRRSPRRGQVALPWRRAPGLRGSLSFRREALGAFALPRPGPWSGPSRGPAAPHGPGAPLPAPCGPRLVGAAPHARARPRLPRAERRPPPAPPRRALPRAWARRTRVGAATGPRGGPQGRLRGAQVSGSPRVPVLPARPPSLAVSPLFGVWDLSVRTEKISEELCVTGLRPSARI